MGAARDRVDEKGDANAVTVVLVPFPAQGHVTPMLHLARALAARGVAATVAVPDFIHRRIVKAGGGVELASIPSGIPDGDGADTAPGFATIVQAMERHMPAHLERMLMHDGGLVDGRRAACLVVDVLASWAVPVAARCGVTAVGFWPAMLASYRVVAAIPELIDKGFISEYGIPILANGFNKDQSQVKANIRAEIISLLPAELELSTTYLPWLVGDSVTQKSRFTFWLQTMERAKSLRCILVNSFPGKTTGAVVPDQQHPLQNQQILPVGPLLTNAIHRPKHNNNTNKLQGSPLKTKNTSMSQSDRTCIDWLDQQRPGSVTYVSFGTWVAPIAPAEITELALGLQATGRPFLWVLKDDPSWRAGLPAGYTTESGTVAGGRGRIVTWAPQEDVLAHGAVGCYLTHCGWNSTMEAIRHGVRMLCYPVSGDQFINCAYIVKVWGVGIRLRSTDRGEVEDCVGRIVEGEEGRRLRVKLDELRERVMAGEAVCTAERNIEDFIDGIMYGTERGCTGGLFWD
uniref:Glycosyltransferase n=1 Tax=Leersia perrieri TaxID=77586 RepID=A0A0D9VIN5_9ORYZ